jgi:glycosyltransferase involved in cell wall biosynthesis
MKVGFNARLLADPNTRGWNRYTVNLLAELPNFGVRPILYTDRPIHPEHLARLPAETFEVRRWRMRPYLAWEQIWLARRCARDGVDLLHAPANFGLPRVCSCPCVLTLHDAIGARSLEPRARLLHEIAQRAADAIITVSEHAKSEIVKAYRLKPAKLRVIPEAADPALVANGASCSLESLRQLQPFDEPYFLYVGGWEKRKNVRFLIDAFMNAQLTGVCLIVAGHCPDEVVFPFIKYVIKNGNIGQFRFFSDGVSEADLAALYSGALAFVYPSKHEGFGLQLCEAMALGCPVLAARASSLPEVLGAGGETFALNDTSELVALMKRVASDSSFRDDLVRRARLRSADFSWKTTAEKTVAVYREVLNSSA